MAYPANMACITQIDLGAVVGKVRQDDTDIDTASEDTSAKTSDRCRCCYCQNDNDIMQQK